MFKKNNKGTIRSRKSQDRKYNGKNKKGQTTIYKQLQQKTKNLAARTPQKNSRLT